MRFQEVAYLFAEIEQTSSRLTITEQLAGLFSKATPRELQELCYLSLGVLQPSYRGMQFGIAHKMMIPVVAEVLGISNQDVEKDLRKQGDLGLIIEQGRWSKETVYTLTSVYNALSEIERISGLGSQEAKKRSLVTLLKGLTPLCAKYVVRIVLGTLRLGFSDMTIIDALSWMETGNKSLRKEIEDAYNVCADIGLVAAVLKREGIEKVTQMTIHIGIPVRLAAAERMQSAQAIMDKIGPCVAQPKLDGFRIQVHIDKRNEKPKIYFFSRNLLNISSMFPDLVLLCKRLSVKTMIAEGEAILYDTNLCQYLPFQETVKRKRKYGIDEMAAESPLYLFFFDLLYLNGQSLLLKTHEQRRMPLIDCIQLVDDDRLNVIDEKKITSTQELKSFFFKEVQQGVEGLVVKRPNAPYIPGKRNFNWIKLKYEDGNKISDTIDVVILGYYAGKGKRAHFGIGAFLAGVYDAEHDLFQTVAKVGTGLSDVQWADLKVQCDQYSINEKPKNVRCESMLTPTTWLLPRIVCEVCADEITRSPLHTAGKKDTELGFALRFPRFVRYRPDKTPEQITTPTELKKLFSR